MYGNIKLLTDGALRHLKFDVGVCIGSDRLCVERICANFAAYVSTDIYEVVVTNFMETNQKRAYCCSCICHVDDCRKSIHQQFWEVAFEMKSNVKSSRIDLCSFEENGRSPTDFLLYIFFIFHCYFKQG